MLVITYLVSSLFEWYIIYNLFSVKKYYAGMCARMYRKQIGFVRDRHVALSLIHSLSRFYVDFIIIILIFECLCECVCGVVRFYDFTLKISFCGRLSTHLVPWCNVLYICVRVCVAWCEAVMEMTTAYIFPDAPQCAP